MEHVSNKDDVKTSLRKVVKEVRSGYCMLTSDWGDGVGDVPAEQRKLKVWVVSPIIWRETVGKKAVIFGIPLWPAMKYFVGIEVYHKQEISKQGTQNGFPCAKGRGLLCACAAAQLFVQLWFFSRLRRHLMR